MTRATHTYNNCKACDPLRAQMAEQLGGDHVPAERKPGRPPTKRRGRGRGLGNAEAQQQDVEGGAEPQPTPRTELVGPGLPSWKKRSRIADAQEADEEEDDEDREQMRELLTELRDLLDQRRHLPVGGLANEKYQRTQARKVYGELVDMLEHHAGATLAGLQDILTGKFLVRRHEQAACRREQLLGLQAYRMQVRGVGGRALTCSSRPLVAPVVLVEVDGGGAVPPPATRTRRARDQCD
jgi:hypothetical protein